MALFTILFQCGSQLVFFLVYSTKVFYLLILDLVDDGYQVAHAMGVYAVTKFDLRFHLVSFGYRNLAHVVTKPHKIGPLKVVPSCGGPAPHVQLFVHCRVLPVAGDHLAFDPHPAHDEPKLSVAMGRLVQVHEVHVNFPPGDIAVELGMQMAKRFLQDLEAVDPHFCR